MNAITEFATCSWCLTVHAVNLLLWKKILSFPFFKIITESRPSTLLRVFLMARLGCPTKGGSWGRGCPCKLKNVDFPLLLDITPTKKLSPPVPPLITEHILENILAFYQKFCLRDIFSTSQSITNLKKLLGAKSINTK